MATLHTRRLHGICNLPKTRPSLAHVIRGKLHHCTSGGCSLGIRVVHAARRRWVSWRQAPAASHWVVVLRLMALRSKTHVTTSGAMQTADANGDSCLPLQKGAGGAPTSSEP